MKTKKILSLLLVVALVIAMFAPSIFANPAAMPISAEQTYIVQEGDTLSEIASKYGVTFQEIVKANGIENPDLIHVGQKLVIPGGSSSVTKLSIVHTNDTHSRVFEGKYSGMGLDKVATIVNNVKAENPNTLVLDAGDTFHGQTIATLNEGESIVNIMNEIGYDVMTAGNHDFNYGQDRLLELAEIADFDIISANVYKADYNTLLPEYVIKEVGGLKIGIFGLATPETTYKTHPDNVKGLKFVDPVIISKLMVAELKDKVDVVICLAHLGLDETSEFTSELIAKNVDGIDLIVDGHSHHDLQEGLVVNGTLIVQTGEYDKNVGIVELMIENGSISSKTAKLITKEEAADLEPDSAVVAVIEEVQAANEVITSVEVGETAIKLLGERGDVRTSETNLGNLIADAMIAKTGADVALTNGGGIRASIEPGVITVGDVITVLPFGNYVVTKKVTGADILAALENGLEGYPDTHGAFPHISGMTVTFDSTKDAGSRVVKVLIGGESIAPSAEYILATNDFLAAGGDNYEMFEDCETLGEFPGLDEILIEYIQTNGTDGSPVEGRINHTEEITQIEVELEPAA